MGLRRFWSKVDKSDDCWMWQAGVNPQGYGCFRYRGGCQLAHRVSWALEHNDGDLPDKCVLHRCDTPACVRPDHLFLGTRADNQRDMARKGRSARGIRNARQRLTPGQVREIRERYASGEREADLRREFNISQGAANHILGGRTWCHITGGKDIRRFARAKLSEDDVLEIRERYQGGGVTQDELADEFGVHQATIWSAVRGHSWAEISATGG